MTPDYKRNGTATLLAALNTLDGSGISIWQERHRHQEWLKFLRLLDDATPDDKQLHLIVDKCSARFDGELAFVVKSIRRKECSGFATGNFVESTTAAIMN